jgi:type IV pilus assembly protein PilB
MPHRESSKPRLGEALVAARVITPEQLERALQEQSSWGGRLGQSLLALGFLGEGELAAAIATQFNLPLVDLDAAPPPETATRLLPVTLAERYGVLALGPGPAEGRVHVACIDPTNNEAMTEVRRATGLVPEPCVATPSQIERVIRRNYYGETRPLAGPDPRLNVTRAVAPESAVGSVEDRLGGLSERIERLVELVEDEHRQK